MSSKVICHIDLNAFFVRCEELKDRSLIGKPVAIGHEGRAGIVSTSSYEARKYGVRSGMPMFKAKQLCPHLIIKPVDFHYYHKKSNEFINFIKKHTPIIEQMSVDECFADFTEQIKNVKDPLKYFKEMQDTLYKETGLMCSIGIASTKFLAKMASDIKKPMGITVIRKKDIKNIIYPLEIESFFGIGKKTSPRLRSIGINTIGDLAEKLENNDELTNNILGKFRYDILEWLHGEGSDEVSPEPSDPKSIGNSTTLYSDTDELEEVKNTLRNLSQEVSERAKEENKIGTTIQIVIKTPDFRSYNKSSKLDFPTNDAKVIYEKAASLYEKNFSGRTIRLIGVTLQHLMSPQDIAIQMSFDDYEKHEEENATRLLINDLNRKLEKPILIRASEVKKKKDGNK